MFYINPYFLTSLSEMTFAEFLQIVALLYSAVFIVGVYEYYKEYQNPCVEDENGNMVIPFKDEKK